MDRKEIKKEAKEFAFNNKWNIWKPFLITIGISFIVGFILGLFGYGAELVEVSTMDGYTFYELQADPVYEIVTTILAIALIPLNIGICYYIMQMIRGNQLDIKEVFSKYKYFLPLLILTVLIGLFVCLWTILLIVPGIIYAFKVSMAGFIAADEMDETTKPMDVIKRSKEMMDGHKWEYFVFNLSFIGWFLLVPLTLGIILIWLVPYIQTANIMYYERLKKLS